MNELLTGEMDTLKNRRTDDAGYIFLEDELQMRLCGGIDMRIKVSLKNIVCYVKWAFKLCLQV